MYEEIETQGHGQMFQLLRARSEMFIIYGVWDSESSVVFGYLRVARLPTVVMGSGKTPTLIVV